MYGPYPLRDSLNQKGIRLDPRLSRHKLDGLRLRMRRFTTVFSTQSAQNANKHPPAAVLTHAKSGQSFPNYPNKLNRIMHHSVEIPSFHVIFLPSA